MTVCCRLSLIAAVVVGLSGAVRAAGPDEPVPLHGNMTMYQDLCPGGAGSQPCILSFYIEGEAAKLLFDGMRVEPTSNECMGGTDKFDTNGLYCNRADDGTVYCEFGYDTGEGRFVYGGLGC